MNKTMLSPRTWLLTLLALAMLIGALTPFATPPTSAAGITFWSATFTVPGGSGANGCTEELAGEGNACHSTGVLTDDDFTYDNVEYAFKEIILTPGGTFAFRLDKEIPADIRSSGQFHFDDMTLDFQDARITTSNTRASWRETSLSWSTGDRVQMRLSDPNRAGGLDRTFGIGGKLTTAFKPEESEIYDIVEQPDGKIVAVGYAWNINRHGNDLVRSTDFAIARYNPDGSLDGSFGNGGRVLTDFTVPGGHRGEEDAARAVALQSDGKIVVAGYAKHPHAAREFVVARYTPSGQLDTTFGTAYQGSRRGFAIWNASSLNDAANDVVIQTINNQEYILVAGQAGESFGIARYTPNGTLDSGFGEIIQGTQQRHGYSTLDFPGRGEGINAVAIDANNKIVVAGFRTNGGGTENTDDDHKDLVVRRITTAGDPDGTFGTNGNVIANFSGSQDDVANAIAIQSNGKIVVAGYSRDKWLLARYNTGGALDREFGTVVSGTNRSGSLRGSYGSVSNELTAVTVKSDGKIVTSGYVSKTGESARVMFRTEDDGDQDSTFSGWRQSFDRYDDRSRGMALLDDGRVMLGGYTSNGMVKQFSLSRYNANGSLDDDFGMAGEVTTSFGSKSAVTQSVALMPDGRIVAAGYAKNDNSSPANASDDHDDFAVARYNATGAHDISFGNVVVTVHRSGRLTTSFSAGDDQAAAVGVHGGKTIVAGHGKVGGGSPADDDFIVAKYHSSGERDNAFGQDVAGDGTPDGWQQTFFIPPQGSEQDDQAKAMVIQSDGKIVLAGFGNVGSGNTGNDFAVARFTAAGALDTTFGEGEPTKSGRLTTDFNALNDSAQAIAIAGNDGFVVVGYATNDDGTTSETSDDHKDFAAALYSSAGVLNTTFATDGKTTLDFSGGHDQANAVAVDGDGKFVVAGYTADGSDNKDFAVVRYNTDGTLDTSFSSDGKVTTSIGVGDAVATAVAVQPSGKVLVAGYASNHYTGDDFALVRYNTDGTLDTSFGIGGKVLTDFAGTDDRAHAMVRDGDGFILLAGQSGDEFALARYLPERSLSTDTRLSGLSMTTSTDGSTFSAGALTPDFSPGTAGYSTPQPLAGVTHVRVTPTTRDPNASVTVNGRTTVSGAASAAVPVTAGSTTTVTVVVTAEDGRTTRTYNISVQVLSNDATLSALSVSTSTDGSTFGGAGTLTPTFAPGTTAYETDLLPKEVTRVKVTPTASDSGATITVQGTATTSGSASTAIAVAQGSTTTVNVIVTAEDGQATQTYTIGVRVRSPGAHIAVAPNPVAEGAEAQITVTIPEAQSQNVTIPITTTAVSAEPGDYSADASIVISAGSLTGTGTLRALQDADAEDETLTVALGSNLPSPITPGSPNSVTVTIDDDEFVSTVTIQGTSPNPVTEGETAYITLGISPAQPNRLVIPVVLSHGTSEAGDFSALTSITIEAGLNSGFGQIQTNHDSDDHDETFTVALGTNLPPLTTAGSPSSATITIDDDEYPSFVTIDAILPDPAVEGETIYIRLGIEPAQPNRMVIPLTFTHGTSEAGDFSTISSITIEAHQPQAVGQIQANQDSDKDDETFTVALGSSLPFLIAAGSTSSAVISIEDDDDVVAPKQAPFQFPLQRGDGSLTAVWGYREDHSPYTSVDVEYREKGTTSWTSVSASPELDEDPRSNPRASHTITGLTNGTTYEVRVRARNSEGAGPWSRDIEEGTPAAPPAAPTGLTTETQYRSLIISWTAPSNDVTSYHLRYKESTSSTWLQFNMPGGDEWRDIYATQVRLSRLTSSTTYDVQVRARIDDSTGAWSASAQGTAR